MLKPLNVVITHRLVVVSLLSWFQFFALNLASPFFISHSFFYFLEFSMNHGLMKQQPNPNTIHHILFRDLCLRSYYYPFVLMYGVIFYFQLLFLLVISYLNKKSTPHSMFLFNFFSSICKLISSCSDVGGYNIWMYSSIQFLCGAHIVYFCSHMS